MLQISTLQIGRGIFEGTFNLGAFGGRMVSLVTPVTPMAICAAIAEEAPMESNTASSGNSGGPTLDLVLFAPLSAAE